MCIALILPYRLSGRKTPTYLLTSFFGKQGTNGYTAQEQRNSQSCHGADALNEKRQLYKCFLRLRAFSLYDVFAVNVQYNDAM